MANNPYINKVIYGNNTLMDITDTTATASDVANGAVFYSASGARTVGTGTGGSGDYVTEDELRDTVGWTGKNLLSIPTSIVTYTYSSGITLTVTRDSNGEVTKLNVSGTPSTAEHIIFYNWTQYLYKEGDYILSGGGSANAYLYITRRQGASGEVLSERNTKDTGSVSFSINYSEYDYFRVGLYIPQGSTALNMDFYPMLRYADVSDSTYEPYHVSVKQTLRDAEVIEGKNYLFNDTPTYGGANMVAAKQADGTVKIVGTDTNNFFYNIPSLTTYFQVPVSGTYRLSGCPANGSESNYKVVLQNSSAQTLATDYGSGATVTLQANTDYRYICKVNATNTAVDLTFKPMVCLATESTDYEPYYIPLKDSKFNRSEQRVLGAKNLLVYPYRHTTKTDNGITFTDNGDGSITVSGTATAQATFDFDNQAQNSLLRLAGKSLLMTGGNSSVLFRFINPDVTIDQSTSEQELSFTSADLSNWYALRLVVQNGTAISTPITIYPMLRLASDPDDTYVPYAMTNKELTDKVDRWSSTATVANSQVSFSGLDDTQGWGYKPFFLVTGNSTNMNPTATINTISGAGTSSMSITYDTDADNGASCKLRIIK